MIHISQRNSLRLIGVAHHGADHRFKIRDVDLRKIDGDDSKDNDHRNQNCDSGGQHRWNARAVFVWLR